MATVYRRPAARSDLIAHCVYLTENAGEAVAERFLDCAQSSFNALAEQPGMGAPLTLRRPELAGLRKWRVEKFDSVLIFYFPRQDGVSIVRLLHASQDWWRHLGFIP